MRSFRVLYPVRKQAYKLKLSKKWRIYNFFLVSLLEQDIIRKGQVVTAIELDESDSQKYMYKPIYDNEVYIKESDSGHLLSFYYLIS